MREANNQINTDNLDLFELLEDYAKKLGPYQSNTMLIPCPKFKRKKKMVNFGEKAGKIN